MTWTKTPDDYPSRQTLTLLERLGAEPRPIDRDPGHPFATGTWYSDCPRCRRFAMINVTADGTWQALCRCWPRRRLDHFDLLLAARHVA